MLLEKEDEEFGEKQYKTLRKLVILWLKTIIHQKYRIIKNILIVGLLISNSVFIYLLNILPYNYAVQVEGIFDSHEAKSISIYSLNHLESISKEGDSLKDRFDVAYKKYIREKKKPDYAYYDTKNPKKIQKWWYNNCINQLRRILNMQSRLSDLSQTAMALNPHKKKEINDIIREKGYEEALANMSNYYSRFIPLETYKYLLRTTD